MGGIGIPIGINLPVRRSMTNIIAWLRYILTRSPALTGDQGRSHQDTLMPQPVSSRCNRRARPICSAALRAPSEVRRVLENSHLADFAAAAALSDRHAHPRLMHIQRNICEMIHPARLADMRLCARHPAQTSTF